jgi:hypothetical protein
MTETSVQLTTEDGKIVKVRFETQLSPLQYGQLYVLAGTPTTMRKLLREVRRLAEKWQVQVTIQRQPKPVK